MYKMLLGFGVGIFCYAYLSDIKGWSAYKENQHLESWLSTQSRSEKFATILATKEVDPK